MSRILILFAHPALEKSRVQVALKDAAQRTKGVYLHDLYEEYPDFIIDVEREQQLLLAHHIVIYQHPLYWYSAPALLKEWQDLVLAHGFAYGREGTSLQGKIMGNVVSAGGSKRSYQSSRINRHSLRELLLPFEQSARLCGMRYLPPFAVHGTHDLGDRAIHRVAERYADCLTSLQKQPPDEGTADRLEYLNDWCNPPD